MADESEVVGGISVTASIDDSRVDAELNALLARLRAEAERAQIGIPVGLNQMRGGGGGRAAQPQGTAVSFGAYGGVKGGQLENLAPHLQRQIDAALGKAETQVATSVRASGRQMQAVAVESLAQITSIGPAEIVVKLDTSEFKGQFDAFLAELKTKTKRASSEAKITLAEGEEGGGGKTGLRRKNIRDQGIGTEANAGRVYTYDPEVYAEQDRRAQAKSNRLQEQLFQQQATRVQKPTVGEQALLAALTGPQARPSARDLQELSYLNQSEGNAGRTSATFAPQRSAQERAAFIAADQRRADATARAPQSRTQRPAMADTSASAPYLLPSERPGFRGGSGTAGRVGQRNEEDIARREEERVAKASAQAVSAGRTLRTQGSSLGGFLAGRRDLIEAEASLAAANERVRIAQRRVADPAIIANTRAHRHAVEELAVAENDRVSALKKIESFSGVGAAARNLLGIAAAGAAFGLAFKGLDIVLDLTGKALDPLISRALGFSNVAGRVTDALSDQTKQAYGNATAVVAVAQAQAGLSASSSKIITPLITQQTQIEAGNKSLTEAVDLFQTYQRLSQQGTGGIERGTGGFLGSGLFGTAGTEQELGRLLGGLPGRDQRSPGGSRPGLTTDRSLLNPFGLLVPGQVQNTPEDVTRNLAVFADGLDFANAQVVKGGEKFLKFVDATADPNAVDRAVRAAQDSHAPIEFVNALRDGAIGIQGLSSDAEVAAQQLHDLALAANVGSRRPDPEVLAAQFAQQRQAQINAANRQQQFALNTQLPAQAALGRLVQPFQPTGTGIAAANSKEAAQIAASGRETADIQQEINGYYEKGRQILATTYRVPLSLLDRVKSVSADIADIQAGISNEQAVYQTAQFNYQLQIARRSLSDIGGLTGRNFGEGKSYLGVLEQQNLALSRQGQLLSFELNQRQINFQTAIAGFEAPGITPAERQARIKEAQIEASFAQKQLDIQKQMFGNQVQIVDISNLRQGVDLANQIGLLLQGRQVTLDTALAQEKLTRLDAQQKMLVDNVGTYIAEVDSLTAAAFGEIQQLEAAAGGAMTNIATNILAQFGIFIGGLNGYLEGVGQSGGSGRNQSNIPLAGGALFSTNGPTDITVGEADHETVAVLRNPRAYLGAAGGGGDTYIVDVHDNVVRSESDLDALARRVVQSMGRTASQIGLRTGG